MTEEAGIPLGMKLRCTLRGHEGIVNGIAWSPDGKTLASGAYDRTAGLWDAASGTLRQRLKSGITYSMAWSPDGRMLAVGSVDRPVGLWDMASGTLRQKLKGHTGSVYSVTWSPDGGTLASGSDDKTVGLWDAVYGALLRRLEGHTDTVDSVAWSPDGRTLASGSNDATVGLWDAASGALRQMLKGHRGPVLRVAWSPDGRTLASGSDDSTVRVWDTGTGRLVAVLEGHTDVVTSVSFSADGRLLVSKSIDGTVRLWQYGRWETTAILDEPSAPADFWAGLAFHPSAPTLATLGEKGRVIRIWDLDLAALLGMAAAPTFHYINAKAVLVGDSGVGKSGLGIRLAGEEFRPTESTHGAQFWQISAGQVVGLPDHVQAELTLWDLAGQPEYRLTHQLFLGDIDAALLLFDCSDPADPFRGVPYWAKVLRKQAPQEARKLLVSARCDVSSVTVGQREIQRVVADYALDGYVRTSAKRGDGVEELKRQVIEGIAWEQLPQTTTPVLFNAVRELLLERREKGKALVAMAEVRREAQRRCGEQEGRAAKVSTAGVEVETAVRLLQGRGLVYRLQPSPQVDLVLLKPELINQYASAVIQAAQAHPDGIGSVAERDVLTADLLLEGVNRLESNDERAVLEATVELLIEHDLCFREMGLLVFPSQINVTRPAAAEEHPPTEVTYRFSGSVEAIYASLVVRLGRTDYFKREDQWCYAVEFSRAGKRLGFAMRQVEEGTGELEIYFYPGVNEFDRVTFIRFVTEHLRAKGIDIKERIRLYCGQCKKEVENRAAIEARVQLGKLDIPCQYCGAGVIIPHSIEEKYRSDRSYVEKQQELAERAEKRTEKERDQFKADRQQYGKEKDGVAHILHLSDLHLATAVEARKYLAQLETDLRKELHVDRLEYLVISGDVGVKSCAEEYEVAFEFTDLLVKRFGLHADRVVVVPGNHDLNWEMSEDAYPFVPRRKLPERLPKGCYISAGEVGALVRDDEAYWQRFAKFSTHFHKRVYQGREYPLNPAEQAAIQFHPDDRLLFIGLNSCWEIDHHFRERAGINMEALANALGKLQEGQYDGWLKIAVWHHPVTGQGMMNDEFMQLLAAHGFQVCLHGHVHEAIEGYHKYDDKRGLHIVGAGTFGATTRDLTPGFPWQYNLLALDPETRVLTVETRKREKADGAWMADARWGDKRNPEPKYTIKT